MCLRNSSDSSLPHIFGTQPLKVPMKNREIPNLALALGLWSPKKAETSTFQKHLRNLDWAKLTWLFPSPLGSWVCGIQQWFAEHWYSFRAKLQLLHIMFPGWIHDPRQSVNKLKASFSSLLHCNKVGWGFMDLCRFTATAFWPHWGHQGERFYSIASNQLKFLIIFLLERLITMNTWAWSQKLSKNITKMEYFRVVHQNHRQPQSH